jgi:hypothetical protein
MPARNGLSARRALRAAVLGSAVATLTGVSVLLGLTTAGWSAEVDPCRTPVAYPGDNASQTAIAQWMARGARAREIPGELPVMAALVASGLRNLHTGDADSVGYFQMRTGIWNQGRYAGFPDNPELQLTWFVDQALAVKQRAIAAGDAAFGSDPRGFGEWIADVERPAEQFRGRYQLRLEEARALTACAPAPPPITAPPTTTVPPTTTAAPPTTTTAPPPPPVTVPQPPTTTPKALEARLVGVRVVAKGGTRTLRVTIRVSARAAARVQLRRGAVRFGKAVTLRPGASPVQLSLPATLAKGGYRLRITLRAGTATPTSFSVPVTVPAGVRSS